MDTPASRLFSCFYDHSQSWGHPSDNPMCQQLWDTDGGAAMYDWMSNADGAADSKSESKIPDGKLCSANNPRYSLLDTPSAAWPATAFNPDSDGKYTFAWTATAPHATKYYRVYLTKQGYDPAQPLKWSDLEKVYETGPSAASSRVVFRTALPQRTGRQLIYTIWQRSDSQEAFFACSDVNMGGGATPTASPTATTASPTPTATSASPTPTPTTASPTPTTPVPTPTTSPGLSVQLKFNNSEWGGYGRGEDVVVTNNGTTAIGSWKVEVPWPSNVSSVWNATGSAANGTLSAASPSWGGSVAPNSTTSFGFNDYSATIPNPQTCTATLNGVSAACSIAGATASPTASPTPTATTASPSPSPTSASPTPSPTTASPTPTPTSASPTPTQTSGSPSPAPTTPAGFSVAPYVDMNQTPDMNTLMSQSGVKTITAAFILDGGGCTPSWGATVPINGGNGAQVDARNAIEGGLNAVRAAGGDYIVSFGGAAGSELATTCSDVTSLKAAYQAVIDRYSLTRIDFDIEGAAITNTTANVRRAQAIAALQADAAAAGRTLTTTFTLPVVPTGLDNNGTAFVSTTKNAGARIDLVNVMAMDYGSYYSGPYGDNMSQAAIDAGVNTAEQIKSVWPGTSGASLMAHIGITPMIGVNDVSPEFFSITNATNLGTWARANGLGELAWWSMTRDKPCANNAKVLDATCSGDTAAAGGFAKAFTGSGSAAPTPTTSASPTPAPTSASPSPTATSATPTPKVTTVSPTPTATSATPTPSPTATSATPTPTQTSATPTPSTTVTPTSSPGEPAPPTGKKQIAYYTSWSAYGRNYQVADIPANQLTHINYAFANLNTSGQCVLGDSWIDNEKAFTGDTWDQPVKGNFNQLLKLKAANPGLKTLISVGGWTWSKNFPAAAASASARDAMADSCVAFMKKYGFDGIDIDWEYPVEGGLYPGTAADKQNYTLLLQALRSKLDAQGTADGGKKYLLTIAAPAGPGNIANLEPSAIADTVDWINLMTYDYHGKWDKNGGKTGFNAPLYAPEGDPGPAGFNASATVSNYLSAGVPARQLVLGIPFYGRGAKDVTDANNGLHQSFGDGMWGTWDNYTDTDAAYTGVFDYEDLAKNYVGKTGWARYWDSTAKVPYLWNSTTKQFISYDDPQSLQVKAEYIKAQGLGGSMFWEMSADTSDYALLDSLNQNMG